MIKAIEDYIVERLKNGMGKMAAHVGAYQGELDDDLGNAIRKLPAAWVTYGGSQIASKATGNNRFANTATFAVMCAARSVRNQSAGARGGVDMREIGCYQLIEGVRRLLDGQGLNQGLQFGLQPKAVKTIINQQMLNRNAISIYAVEYTAIWDECTALEQDTYPQKSSEIAIDKLLTNHQGKQSPEPPELKEISGKLFDPTNNAQTPINTYLNKLGQDND